MSSAIAASRQTSRIAWIRTNGLTILAVVMATVAVASHLVVAFTASAPVYWDDEAGYLLNAQVISGFGVVPHLDRLSYYPGWSFFLVPLWWIFRNPDLVFRGAVVMSALFGAGTAVPLAFIARRFGLNWPKAILAATVIIAAPGLVLMSNYAISENCLTFFVALTVLAALRYAESPSLLRAGLLGAVSGYLFVVHGRAIPAVIATGLWFLFQLFRHRRWSALFGAAVMAVVAGGGLLVYYWCANQMYTASDREANGVAKLLTSNILGSTLAGTGQVWYHVVASAGLAAFGLVAIGVLVVREIRGRVPATATWLAVLLIGVAAISFTYISGGAITLKPRLDIYVYGRYLAPFVVVVQLAGAIALLRVASRRFVLWTAIGTAVFVGGFALFGKLVLPTLEHGGWWAPVNVVGLAQYKWPNVTGAIAIPLLWPSIVTVVAVALAVLLRKRPAILIGALIVFMGVSSVIAMRQTERPFAEPFYHAFTLKTIVREYDATHVVTFDDWGLNGSSTFGTDSVSHNAYQFWLVPRSPASFDSSVTAPTSELVISRPTWPVGEKLGYRLMGVDTVFKNALWVEPGALQDRLASQGKLLPNPTK